MTTKELIREKIDAFYTEYKAKFHQNGDSYHLGIIDGLDMAERILDTLPDESEQPTRGYDEAYLNEKIAKASKSWKGIDVDKFMDEIRGREKTVTDCHDLEEEMEKYIETFGWGKTKHLAEKELISATARHFAEWGAEHLAGVRKMISGDLEEAAENPYVLNDVSHAAFEYERTRNDLDARSDNEVVRRAFIAGAEWQKKQIPMPEDTVIFQKGVEEGKRLMMEGAANAYILKSYNPVTEQGGPTLHAIEIELVYEDEGKPYLIAGQKARIIILPKED